MNSPTTKVTPAATAGPDRRFLHGRAAAAAVDEAEHLVLALPMIGRVRLPKPEQLAYLGGIALLAAVDVLDWPAALVLGIGHAMVSRQHNRALQEFGEALEHV